MELVCWKSFEEGPALVVDEVDSIGLGDKTRLLGRGRGRGGGDGREAAKVGAEIESTLVACHSSSPTNDGQWTTPPTTRHSHVLIIIILHISSY